MKAQTLKQVKEEGKNIRTQPHHTQGELKYRLLSGNDKEGTFIVYEDEGQWVLFSIQYGKHLLFKTKEEAEANAQRIVKAVNMHDELVEFMKKLYVEYMFGQYNQASILGISEESRDKILSENSMVIKYKELLKQAE